MGCIVDAGSSNLQLGLGSMTNHPLNRAGIAKKDRDLKGKMGTNWALSENRRYQVSDTLEKSLLQHGKANDWGSYPISLKENRITGKQPRGSRTNAVNLTS